MSAFSGSLQPKKKQELQEIAIALDISETGTRDELQQRIKHYLGLHEGTLSEDTRFAGLYGRSRKRSVQPQLPALKEDAVSVSSEDHEEKARPQARKAPRQVARARATPSINDSFTRVAAELNPADLPPLPPSPIPSAVAQAASTFSRDATALMQRAKQPARSLALEGGRLVKNTQTFLSDANTIYSITVLAELAFILNAVFPVSHLRVPLNAPYKADDPFLDPSTLIVSIPYPTPEHLLSLAPWVTIAQWIVPTFILPLICGTLVSFSTPPREIDPLTVGIIRVACSVASRWGIEDTVLPSKWRILSSSIGAAFAFAEAVGRRKSREV